MQLPIQTLCLINNTWQYEVICHIYPSPNAPGFVTRLIRPSSAECKYFSRRLHPVPHHAVDCNIEDRWSEWWKYKKIYKTLTVRDHFGEFRQKCEDNVKIYLKGINLCEWTGSVGMLLRYISSSLYHEVSLLDQCFSTGNTNTLRCTREEPGVHEHKLNVWMFCFVSSLQNCKYDGYFTSCRQFFLISRGGVRLVHLARRPLFDLLYQSPMIDDECEAVGGMRIGRGNRSIRR
jgi:hypothetical protein